MYFPANSGYIVTKEWDDPILPRSYREKNILFPVTAGKNLYTCHANFGYSLTNTPMVSLLRVTVRSGQGGTQDTAQCAVNSAHCSPGEIQGEQESSSGIWLSLLWEALGGLGCL